VKLFLSQRIRTYEYRLNL